MEDKNRIQTALNNFHVQIETAWDNEEIFHIEDEIENIVVAGSGSSIISGHILKNYLSDINKEIIVIENYKLPNNVSRNSLIFVISYGKDLDETISMYRDALKKGSHIILIDDNRKLSELSKLNDTKHIKLSREFNVLHPYGVLFFSMLKVLYDLKLIQPQEEFVRRTLKVIKHNNFEQLAQDLAEKLKDKIPLIYSTPQFESVAIKWKNNFNLISKTPSFCSTFPTVSHNEVEGFAACQKDFHVLIIKSDFDNKNIKAKIKITKEEIRKKGVPVTEMEITGDCYLTKIFSALLIGDWLSYNLAVIKNIDPEKTPVTDAINK